MKPTTLFVTPLELTTVEVFFDGNRSTMQRIKPVLVYFGQGDEPEDGPVMTWLLVYEDIAKGIQRVCALSRVTPLHTHGGLVLSLTLSRLVKYLGG